MKLTKSKLKQLIKEALQDLNETWGEERRELKTAKVGDYVEIEISDDGHNKSIELIDPKNYEPTLGDSFYRPSIKLLAKIESVQTRAGEEDEEADEGDEDDAPNPMAQL